MQFDAIAMEIKVLIEVEFHHFEHFFSGRSSVACDQYFVSHHVKEHVNYITPSLKLLASSSPRNMARVKIKKRTFDVMASTSNLTDFKASILLSLKTKLPINVDTLLS